LNSTKIPYLGFIENLNSNIPPNANFICGIGNNKLRKEVVIKLNKKIPPNRWVNAIHPTSIISLSCKLGVGIFIAAGVILSSNSKIDNHVIINTGSSIDHDCVINKFVHIAPGCRLCGTVTVGPITLIGVGTSIIPDITVGSNCIVGAGSVVLSNITDNTTTYGIVKKNKL
jgi:acetyltransferase EpsM